jgi:hypothetical protein
MHDTTAAVEGGAGSGAMPASNADITATSTRIAGPRNARLLVSRLGLIEIASGSH